ncbi:SRPBCC family protein [Actinoplanes sp. NPDC051851]|uniref:type II toxin-antitoxin system Rv0910 family toxin n=1 Tax=Actinoplanes sp. NPDC051851 TaxID=3154753 RepID=UPI00343F1804
MPLRRILTVARTHLTRRPPAPAVPPAIEPPRRLAHPVVAVAEVPLPPTEVFAILAVPARMADWLVMHAAWPSAPPAVLTYGSAFRQRVRLMGTPTEVRWTVAGVEPSRAVWLDGTGPLGIEVGFYLSLTPSGSGTIVRCDGGVQGGPTDGPLGPMVARNLADAIQKSLNRLAGPTPASARTDPARTGPARAEPPLAPASARPASARPVPSAGPKPAPIRHLRSGAEIDPWAPVIVGAGQVTDRASEGDPVSLAVRALREAGLSAEILKNADTVGWVASVSWQYADAAALIAEAVGAAPAETVQTGLFGGDGPLRLVNDVAARIAAGEIGIALLCGAEAAATAAAAERAGRPLDWPRQPDGIAPSRVLGADREPNNDVETAAGLIAPIYLYALIESAIRTATGLTAERHRERITRLWARFSEVAAENPYAWRPQARNAAELAAVSVTNRPVAWPYPKLLTADLRVDQGTGLILCSAAAAHDAGIPQDRWIFVHAGAHAEDEWFVTERADLATSPALRAIGETVLDHTGLSIGDIEHLDLYGCFPSAVQIAAAELGLPADDPERPLTVTGGLTFAGGPGNNYASHAVANLVSLLRATPDEYGLVTAVGWYLTKHAATILSARPPRSPFRDIDVPVVAATRTARLTAEPPDDVEAFTVTYRRDGEPEAAVLTALTPDGTRLVHRTTDRALIDRLLAGDPGKGRP